MPDLETHSFAANAVFSGTVVRRAFRRSQWQGTTFGQDSDGNRWTTFRWRDITITTVEPPRER
jgi:hypothetical protein